MKYCSKYYNVCNEIIVLKNSDRNFKKKLFQASKKELCSLLLFAVV